MRRVNGDVQEMRCGGCGAVLHRFVFTADTDMETDGLCSASRCNRAEVVIAEATPEEWNAFEDGGAANLEKRLAEDLNLPDLRVLRLRRVEQRGPSAFARIFLPSAWRTYERPDLIYACPCCEEGEVRAVAECT